AFVAQHRRRTSGDGAVHAGEVGVAHAGALDRHPDEAGLGVDQAHVVDDVERLVVDVAQHCSPHVAPPLGSWPASGRLRKSVTGSTFATMSDAQPTLGFWKIAQ